VISSEQTYKAFADYYDLYVGDFKNDIEIYTLFCDTRDNILEVGCGTGRILRHFLESGYCMTGIDISEEMLAIAKKRLLNFEESGRLTISNHDFTNSAFHSGFEKVLVTFYTFNYIIEKPLQFLKNINKSLNANGLLILDLFYPRSLLNPTAENKWEVKTIHHAARSITLKDKRSLKSEIEYRTQIFIEGSSEIQIDTERRYFNPVQMKELLVRTGFQDICFSIGYANNGFNEIIDEKDITTNFIVKASKPV
jgi:SAM-dependent methyltransferase